MSAPSNAAEPRRDETEQVDILIVDDRAENLLALEAILEPLGQRLVRASSGEEALRKLLTRDFAVILLDVQMPGMNGFDTARLIKSRERTRHIPIIFLTAISKDEEFVFAGYSVGAVDYLFKPFQPDILRSKVATFVDLHLRQRRIAEQEAVVREGERRELELKHMRELLESERRYSEIVGSAMDAIITFDEHGMVTLFNAAAEQMFGAAVAKTIGQPITRFFPTRVSSDTVRQVCDRADHLSVAQRREMLADEQVASFTAVRSSGEEFPIEASVSCLDTPHGRSYTLIVRDISERRRHEQALREQALSLERTMRELTALNEELNERQAALEQAMSARSRFYASMSHELRTPINAVLGYSTLLLENIYGPLNEKQQEGIERTQKAARHLLELVNDVLDLSKIEAGKIDLRLQPVAIPALVEDLFVTVRPLADQYGSALTLEQPSAHPLRVVSDPRRVRQILLNLLSNAIKFGNGKPVRVVCRACDEGGVAIEVIDEGAGIPPEDQERIFQEFVQLGKTQLHEGTGLGLPISRRLAELLHGSLEVDSRVGAGSTFRLVLPATADARQGGEVRVPRRDDHEVTPAASNDRATSGSSSRAGSRPAESAASG